MRPGLIGKRAIPFERSSCSKADEKEQRDAADRNLAVQRPAAALRNAVLPHVPDKGQAQAADDDRQAQRAQDHGIGRPRHRAVGVEGEPGVIIC